MIVKNGYNPTLDLDPTFGVIVTGFVVEFPRKSWYREVEGSFLSPFHDLFCSADFFV